ncbi:hypothetical protein [Heliophilum fasciatum]|uniref:Uncharacterized protein n=1 Tax=Heliophilum fasciatum TaxID=35700 RepID=A0A4R2RUR1_9FIRM|nr:hypothetical protein [Heliophilum fasciatum]MCW2277266.1 hypothetical protein [Heliophilum fasciatum]TCP68100.1 hypothetical protein EDD73_1042 [Heliophilum fasciatum]
MGIDVARDGRGQVWLAPDEIVVGSVSEDRLALLVQELRREHILGKNRGQGPFRLPEMANYLFREGTYQTFAELLEAWQGRLHDSLIWPEGWGNDQGDQDPVARALAQMAQIGSLLTQFVQWRFMEAWKREWPIFVRQTADPEKPFEEHPQSALFWEWFVFDRRMRGGVTALQVFLREIGKHLALPLRQAVEIWLQNRPGVYVIERLGNDSFWIKDLFTDEMFEIKDPDYTGERAPYEVGFVLFCRILPWEGVYRYGGVAYFFPPWYRMAIINGMQRIGKLETKERGGNFQELWVRKSRQILFFFLQLRQIPIAPRLLTVEGHLAGASRAIYHVDDYRSLKKALLDVPDLLLVESKRKKGEGEVLTFEWLDQGMSGQLMTELRRHSVPIPGDAVALQDLTSQIDGQVVSQLGTLTINKGYAVIDTVSRERLEQLKKVLFKYGGFFLTHREDTFEPANVTTLLKHQEHS